MLNNIIIRPAEQGDISGCGIGTRLLDGIISWAWQRHIRRHQLLADRSKQRALDFYQGRQWITTNLICLRKIL